MIIIIFKCGGGGGGGNKKLIAAVGSTLFLTTDFDVMTRASFLDRVITMQLDSKYRRNLDF